MTKHTTFGGYKKMRELQAIHADRDQVREAIANAGQGTDTTQWQVEEMRYTDELAEAKVYWDAQQTLQERAVQAKETGYYFDSLKTSEGIEMIDLSYSPENHELQAIAVQKGFLAQQDAFNAKLSDLQYRNDSQARIIEAGTSANQQLIEDNGSLRDALNQANIEKADAYQKLENASNIITEMEAEIKRLESQQTSPQATAVAPLSEAEKESKLMAEVMGKQIKVTNVQAVESDSFLNKMFKATNAVTGAEIEDYYIYLSKINENSRKRYEEVTDETAEQLRADYANKIAEYNAQNNVIPVQEQEIEPVQDVLEEEAPAQETTFQENGHELGEGLQLDGADIGHEVSEEEENSQVDNKRTEVSPEDFEWLDHVVSKLIISLKEKDILPSDWEAAA